MRWAMMAAMLVCGAARAGGLSGPVCGDPGVLRQVDETVRARGQGLVLEVPPVGEVSTAVPGVAPDGGPASSPAFPPTSPPLAHCAVRGHTVAYDTNRYGTTPLYEPFTIHYTVEQRRNGLFVSVD